jgi:hypothetical protein
MGDKAVPSENKENEMALSTNAEVMVMIALRELFLEYTKNFDRMSNTYWAYEANSVVNAMTEIDPRHDQLSTLRFFGVAHEFARAL